MLTASQFLEAGQLNEAISALNADLRSQPMDSGKRYFLAELLCFSGDWERADKQLDMLAHQDSQLMPGILIFRQLLRAAKAREEFFAECRVPEFVQEPSLNLQYYLQASISLRNSREQEAVELLAQAEQARASLHGACNGQSFNNFCDLDDLTASVMEVLTSSGQYYWIPFECIHRISMCPPQRPRDLLWRDTHVEMLDGQEGNFFLPAVYPILGESEVLKLGRATEWHGTESSPVRGLGQRMFMVGDESMSMMEIQEITFGSKQKDE